MYSFSRAQVLISQNKFDLAEKEIRLFLTDNPSNGEAYSLLALSLLGQQKKKEALEIASRAIGLSPYSAYTFYVLSRCHIENEDLEKAETAIKESIRINPEDGDYYNVLALILHDRNKPKEALEIITKALELNPEEASYKNSKAIILRKLNRKDEAEQLANEALYDNPENDFSFASMGWVKLDKNKPKEALEHFKSALAINPTNEYAKSGLVMALKAQNPLFGLFYQYYAWVGRLSSGARWGFVIGVYVLMRILSYIEKNNPEYSSVIMPVIIVYAIFVFLTWTINPIFNLFLRLNRYGRYALDKGEIIASNIILVLIIAGISQLILSLASGFYPFYAGLGTLFMMMTVSGAYNKWGSKSFNKLALYNIALGLTLTLYVFSYFLKPDISSTFFTIHLIGAVAFTWISQFIKN